MSRARGLSQFLAPALVLIGVGVLGGQATAGTQEDITGVLISATMVIALYAFIGNSGVISFGQISFVALGAFAAGLMTIPSAVKPTVLPDLFPFLADHSIGSFESLFLAAAIGALFAFLAGVPLMRLSGLAAGIATFAVLEITHNVLRYWDKIGPGAQTLSLVPEDVGPYEAMLGALFAAAVAFLYQRSRSGRLLRAAREDPPAARSVGVNIHRHRLVAFTISGALAGFAGALLVHQIGSITTEQVYLELTFLTLAMLVVGGMHSLWGAVVGAVLVSFLDIFLVDVESGVDVGPLHLDLPSGASLVILGALMAAMLIFRPSGITGGRELALRVPRPGARGPSEPRAGAGRGPDEGGSAAERHDDDERRRAEERTAERSAAQRAVAPGPGSGDRDGET